MTKQVVLVLGGARSGKSQFAQELASRLGKEVLFAATSEALDEEMRQRIEEHRRVRPANWRTVEAPLRVGCRITEEIGDARVVILDCLTLLVSNVIGQCGDPEQVDAELAAEKVAAEIAGLVDCIDRAEASFLLVSNEVGMGLVPENRVGRLYRDLLGRANRELAQRADVVCFLIAGIPVTIKGAL